ncbi:hypothetical protein BGZ63DRAFT_365883 [Mariannaea sp. PMI_226]|nr:hypothetical protein BGZ63DRAFT_365883 [Mariannaea sp. PMI_226]
MTSQTATGSSESEKNTSEVLQKPDDSVKQGSNTTETGSEELRFSPEEEAQYQDALDKYDDAINSCPKYLLYPRAVIQSNIAACHLKLEQWKDAVRAATNAIDDLAKLEREHPLLRKEDPEKPDDKGKAKEGDSNHADDGEDEAEEEIISAGASQAAPMPPPPSEAARQSLLTDIQRIRSKSLMRRARARSEEGGWQNLAGAEEDYRSLAATPSLLSPADMRIVRAQLRDLPPRTKAAQEKEMGEMWGKLKDLGNGILKPFGLSTENFAMVKDENTGGYSMNFKPSNSS